MLRKYNHEKFFDEMPDAQGGVRSHYRQFCEWFESLNAAEFENKRHSIDLAFLRLGITFNDYEAEKLCGRLEASLQFSTVEEIFEQGFHVYLDQFQEKLNAIGFALFEA